MHCLRPQSPLSEWSPSSLAHLPITTQLVNLVHKHGGFGLFSCFDDSWWWSHNVLSIAEQQQSQVGVNRTGGRDKFNCVKEKKEFEKNKSINIDVKHRVVSSPHAASHKTVAGIIITRVQLIGHYLELI